MTDPIKKIRFNPQKRHQARRLALQALYEWSITQNDCSSIAARYHPKEDIKKTDWDYFEYLFYGIVGKGNELDKHFRPFLDRPLAEMTPIELTILRIGSYELAHRMDVPTRVIINESVELTKAFGATDGHRYVNGILDKVARKVRKA